MLKKVTAAILAAGLMCSIASAGSYDTAISAVMRNDTSALTSVLNKGLDPNTVTPDGAGDTLLMVAVRSGSAEVANLLMSLPNIEVDKPNTVYETPLMLAIFLKNNDLAKKLIARGANVNNPKHWTPLHYAAASGNREMIKILIAKGADVNARTLRGITPLYMAARDSDSKTVKMLLDAGARKDLCTNDNKAPYDIAKERNNVAEIVNQLTYEGCH